MLLLAVALGIWSCVTGACTIYSEDLLLDADGGAGPGAGGVGLGGTG